MLFQPTLMRFSSAPNPQRGSLTGASVKVQTTTTTSNLPTSNLPVPQSLQAKHSLLLAKPFSSSLLGPQPKLGFQPALKFYL